ncbi:uncharacterized protein ARMOST_06994 [Armillaria ostoyae]|uniref:Chromo domain-containing protein n=1 Tax=Armillaria ostoyae TaxID=47428 RepID=A0A284R4J0_ARMOS|nr:uncharacterized protein ARMOST_06994 [Armillaria ostoyae]
MSKIHKETETTLTEATGRMKAQYDKHKRPSRDYHARDLVWLDATNLHLPRPKKKLDDNCHPTGRSTHASTRSSSRHTLPRHSLIRNNRLLLLLTLSKTRKVRTKRGQPSTTVIDYFIKWKGWTQEHNSWVAESDMGNAKEAIADYEKKTQHNERMAVVKIATTSKSPLAMIVNHRFSPDGDVSYLAQREDGTQKWLLNPDVTTFDNHLVEYWQNYYSAQHNTQEMNA